MWDLLTSPSRAWVWLEASFLSGSFCLLMSFSDSVVASLQSLFATCYFLFIFVLVIYCTLLGPYIRCFCSHSLHFQVLITVDTWTTAVVAWLIYLHCWWLRRSVSLLDLDNCSRFIHRRTRNDPIHWFGFKGHSFRWSAGQKVI